ncbi:MAG: YybS family protein [Bacillaceae bacterium]
MKNTRALTEGAIMIAIFTVFFFISTYVPIISLFVTFLLPVPFVVYRIRYNITETIFLIIVGSIVTFMLFSLFSVPVVLMSGFVGYVIGDLVKKGKGPLEIFLKATVAYILSIIGIYILTKMVTGIDMVEQMQTLINEAMKQAQSIFETTGKDLPEKNVQMLQNYVDLIPTILPILFLLVAMVMSLFTCLCTMPILKRLRYNVKKWPRLHEVTLPKQLLGVYLVLLIISFFPINEHSVLYMVILNFLLLFQLLAIFQGITFVFFFFHKKGINKIWRVLFVVMLFFIPLLFSIVMLLGIIDLGFSLRSRL